MAISNDLKITFPLGACDLDDPEAIKVRIISCFDDGSFEEALCSLNTQANHALANQQSGNLADKNEGELPNNMSGSATGELVCKSDSKTGKVSCEVKINFGITF
jgi:hypothetical protein